MVKCVSPLDLWYLLFCAYTVPTTVGPQLTYVYVVVYFRVLHFGCIFFLFRELFLNVCVDNQKCGFGGPYLLRLNIHQYSFTISSEIFAACSRSQRIPSYNLRCQGPLTRPKEV